jgi:hypothetical protein
MDRAAVLGEFGGLGLGLEGHKWSKQFWGYLPMTNTATLTARYCKLLDRVHVLRDSFGLSAAIYTQTTDVETECNGLMTYDRAVSKLDPAVVQAANHSENAEKSLRVIVPDAMYGRVSWKYTLNDPGGQWQFPDFNDAAWKKGVGGFGTEGLTPGAIVGTTWDTADIWLRREFTLGAEDLRDAQIQLHHDEDAEIYFNGVLAAKVAGFSTHYYEINMNTDAADTLKPGVNRMAVHCHQTTGGQFIDVGIVIPRTAKAAAPAK